MRVSMRVGLVTLVSVFVGVLPAVAAQLDLSRFHAKATLSSAVGGRSPMTFEGEVWIKGQKVRLELETPIGPSTTVIDGTSFFVWQEKTRQGVRSALGPGQKSTSLVEINDCLKGLEPDGSDLMGGVQAERYVYSGCGGAPNAETTVWIEKGTSKPMKIEVRGEQGMTSVTYRDVELEAVVPDDLFVPPSDIELQDMTEAMKRAPQAPTPIGK